MGAIGARSVSDGATDMLNEAARSYVWLRAQLLSHPEVNAAWREFFDQASAANPSVAMSDIWLCKSVRDGGALGCWTPPATIDAWPSHGPVSDRGWTTRRSAVGAFDAWLRRQPAVREADLEDRHAEAAKSFAALSGRTPPGQPFSRRTIDQTILNQSLAWIDTTVGGILKGLFLTPARPSDLAVRAQLKSVFQARLHVASDVVGSESPSPFAEDQLTRMFSSRMRMSDGAFVSYVTRGGQSELWRDRWGWLSDDVAAPHAQDAVGRAGAVLASPFVIGALIDAVSREDGARRWVALCVLRRTILGLRVMAWVEHALKRATRQVRPLDVNCFAFAALAPHWPRREIALSHRSQDVKPRLMATEFWRSPRAAVDATYVPQWETNVAMIWSLFAPTPFVIRMKSPSYLKSDWCVRESEMLGFLRNTSDFLHGRRLADAGPKKIAALDQLGLRPGDVPFPAKQPIYAPPLVSEVEGTVLAVGAALRAFGLAYGHDNANAVAELLYRGEAPPLPCLTNNPDGWRPYVAAFHRLQKLSATERPLELKQGAEGRRSCNLAEDAEKFSDLSAGELDVLDVLAAQEWMRVVVGALQSLMGVQQIAVDCRELTQEDWIGDPRCTLMRGLGVLSTSIPIWFVQAASSRVDRWPGIGDRRPIFTQHADTQFSWMEFVRSPPNWLALYLSWSGHQCAPSLVELATGVPQSQQQRS